MRLAPWNILSTEALSFHSVHYFTGLAPWNTDSTKIELFSRSAIPQGESSFIRSSPHLRTWRALRLRARPSLSDLLLIAPRRQGCKEKYFPISPNLVCAFTARPMEYPFHRSVIFSFTALSHGASPMVYLLDRKYIGFAMKLFHRASHRLCLVCEESLTPIRKNNRGISSVERLRTPVTCILIVGLQLH